MKKKILIVEDQFIEAHDLQLILEKAGYQIIGIARSVVQALEIIETETPDLVFVDICLKGKETGIDLAKKLKESHIGFIYLSANSSRSILEEAKITQPYGFIVKPFREQDVLITLEIACYRHNYSIESRLFQEKTLQQNIAGIASDKWEVALAEFAKMIQADVPFDLLQTGFSAANSEMIGLFKKDFDQYEVIDADRLSKISNQSKQQISDLKNQCKKFEIPKIFNGDSFQIIFQNSGFQRLFLEAFSIKSFMSIPVRLDNGRIFNFFFYSRKPDSYTNEHLSLLTKLESCLAGFVDRINSAPTEISIKNFKKTAIPAENPFEGFASMIGKSKKITTVFEYIKKVAPSDTSVLILGESGTGKEKVAQSIHQLSARKSKPLIIINCAAIPENLAESLLFGHEKGAFTGAQEKHIGKFETANGGTVFLDEIGEMPMDLQVKLLRVLQEKEIERIGGKSPVKVDVRIIAATNRNLEEEVAAGRFRLDLYYRLHVFPITVPALRERKDDIPLLANHFIQTFCQQMKSEPFVLSNEASEQLLSYHWPGNIRELEHIIQRSILLSDSEMIKEIQLPPMQNLSDQGKSHEHSIKTIHENERDYITYILKKSKGKVSGIGGAAEILDIPASTLNSKMKKLGIKKNSD